LVGFVAFQAISEPAALGATYAFGHAKLDGASIADYPSDLEIVQRWCRLWCKIQKFCTRVGPLKLLLFLCAEIRCKMDRSLSVGDPS
jgi:hypothetical protein